jgi:hypothetical protein
MNTIKEMLRRWLLDSQPEKMRGLSVGLVEERPPTTMIRTFTLNEAMNGSYITFTRRKYNPNGPDDYRNEIYIVQSGETLIDAISTVLVLTEK